MLHPWKVHGRGTELDEFYGPFQYKPFDGALFWRGFVLFSLEKLRDRIREHHKLQFIMAGLLLSSVGLPRRAAPQSCHS